MTNPIVPYLEKMANKFEDEQSQKGIFSKHIQVGPSVVQLNFAGQALIPTFFHAFRHLALHYDTLPNLTINLYEGERTLAHAKEPWSQTKSHHLGLIEELTDDRYFVLLQPGSDALYVFDKETSIAYYSVKDLQRVPFWESDFPLRMIFHWYFKDTPYQLLHSAALGNNAGGLLLTGKGGSGKSTSTLACINSPVKIAGDDYVLVDTNKMKAYSLFSLCKLTQPSLDLIKHTGLQQNELTEPVDGKYRISLFETHPESLISSLSIKAIVLPKICSNEKSELREAKPSESLLALAPTTLFQLPGLRENAFEQMAAFVKKVPAYTLCLGRDTEDLPDLFQKFIPSLC